MAIPRDPSFDATRAFFHEGYAWVGNRCRTLGSDIFSARLMLRPVTVIAGEEAAARFYDGAHFTRVGAMPQMTMRLLQDKGSVQSLDGTGHAARKALFLSLLDDDGVSRFGEILADCWHAALPRWRAAGTITFHDACARLLCDAICRWAGVPLKGRALDRRTREMQAMIDGAGSVGPRAWRGLLLRRRSEQWARRAIGRARRAGPDTSPVGRIAHWRDPAGERLDRRAAGVELLNLVRPTVAVARFLTFAALALHQHRDAAEWLRGDPHTRALAFAQEVRRFYPFFPVIGGRVTRGFSWSGHRFRPRDWVLLGLHATNHDPRLWDEPARFRPERFSGWTRLDDRLVPQGAGDPARDHRCPGEWLTIETIQRVVALLLSCRFHLPPQDLSIPLDRFPTLPRDGLRVRFD